LFQGLIKKKKNLFLQLVLLILLLQLTFVNLN